MVHKDLDQPRITTDLISYLFHHFVTEQQLLRQVNCTLATLHRLQKSCVMPKPSYVVHSTIACSSYFGDHREQTTLKFYATSYIAWLNILTIEEDVDDPFCRFKSRYVSTIAELATQFSVDTSDITSDLNQLVKEEYQHFLAGTYGVCTQTGDVEEIAQKRFAIALITLQPHNNNVTQLQIDRAVALLDKVAAQFPAHEYERSSRKKYIDDRTSA